jgi:4-hydroxy-tetrahydrodipicolinate synthase
VDGIVPVGTTGESPTVDCEEHIRVIELSVKFSAGQNQSARRHGRERDERGD